MFRVLIIEDQKYPLESLEFAVKKVMPAYIPNFSNESYEVSRCFSDAERRITQVNYEIVLLDHRLPYNDQGDLEKTDFDAFSNSLQNIGYSLIPQIKERSPSTIVIGTSSLSDGELRRFARPDYKMSKMWDDAERDLEEIMKIVSGGKR